MKLIDHLYCVQAWTPDEVWSTVAVVSNGFDAARLWDIILADLDQRGDGGWRLVSFTVDGADFIATHARDFAVLERS